MTPLPPKRTLQFLRWFCREDYLEEIEGDLIELFEQQVSQHPNRARWSFFWQVLLHFRPDFIKSFSFHRILIHPDMLRHNFLITYRGFLRHRSSFLINLSGLSIGLACVLLVYLWVNSEWKIDRFLKNDQQLYRVLLNLKLSDGFYTGDITPLHLAQAMQEELPEVEKAVATNDFFNWKTTEGVLEAGNTKIQASGWHAGPEFFEVLSVPLIAGKKEQVLAGKNSIVISKKLASQLFKDPGEAFGKTLNWEHPFFKGAYEVTGIMETLPSYSSEQFDFLIPIDILPEIDQYADSWASCYATTYCRLKKGTNISAFNKKLTDLIQSKDERNKNYSLFVQPYADQYLYNKFENGKAAGGRIVYIRLFLAVGFLILLIACVNFMNLSTARASLKMKEIGVKKTIGARKQDLVIQFLCESLFLSFLSFGLALVIVALVLSQFNQITGKELQLQFALADFWVLSGIIVLTGLLAGSYPAFYLSSFKPLSVLKGKSNPTTGVVWIRKSLVVTQFAVSILFIVGLMVVNRQIHFTQSKSLGYDRDNLITFQWKGELFDQWNGLLEGKSNQQFETFFEGLKNIPGVLSATNMSGNILTEIYGQSGVTWGGGDPEKEREYAFKSPVVGYDYLQTLGIELLAGRDFSKARKDGYSKIILNQAAVDFMGLTDPIGQQIGINGGAEIIGVTNNFHYGSLHNPVEPLIFRCVPYGRNLLVKIQKGSEKATIERIEAHYSQSLPGFHLEYRFFDQEYQDLYVAESRVASLSNYLAGIAIFISCLGLLGLAAFSAERRSKEIGIRKILGSSNWGVITLLSKDFTKMLILSIVIALPLSYLLAQYWLNGFADRIQLQWWYFVVAGITALLVAWGTVGLQLIKVVRANPVEALQND